MSEFEPGLEPEPVSYRVLSDRLVYGSEGDVVELVPTGAVLALVEGGHLEPVTVRPSAANKEK
jgi:hypothetical protein